MKLGDIIALAKMGFKKEDIDRYLSMETVADPESTEPENGVKALPAGEPKERSPEPENIPKPEETADDHKNEQIQALNEQIQALEDQISDLKKQLENAQKQNVNQNNSGGINEKSDQDILNDIARSFM